MARHRRRTHGQGMTLVVAMVAVIGITIGGGLFILGLGPDEAIPVDLGTGEKTFDHSIWDALLKAYVKDGVVSYAGLKKEESKLDAYISAIGSADVESLSSDEQLALFINAYNAFTVKAILEKYPGITSIKDISHVWSNQRWVLGGQKYRLGGSSRDGFSIENNLLRPVDVRVHFAINCASKSCPPLISEAYTGKRVREQLDAVTRAFARNPKQVRLESNRLRVSKIVSSWYKSDFDDGDYIRWMTPYLPKNIRTFVEKHKGKPPVSSLTYDWSLNGK